METRNTINKVFAKKSLFSYCQTRLQAKLNFSLHSLLQNLEFYSLIRTFAPKISNCYGYKESICQETDGD